MLRLSLAISSFLLAFSQNQARRFAVALLHCMLSSKSLRQKLQEFPEGTGTTKIIQASPFRLALIPEYSALCTKLLPCQQCTLDAPSRCKPKLIFRFHSDPSMRKLRLF